MRKLSKISNKLALFGLVLLFFFESYGKINPAGNSPKNDTAKLKLHSLIAKNRPGLSRKEQKDLVLVVERASYHLRFPKKAKVSNNSPVDKLGFLVGLIQTESQFHTRAKSHKGALGLMQVMPETAKWLAKKEGIPFSSEKELFEPETNLLLGVLYLNYLMERTDSLEATLLAYNAGLGGYKRFGGVPSYSRTVYKYYEEWKQMPIPSEIPISESLASLFSI
ncbi:MAG: lytic transglycosylase domain-containing protein [Leptospira bouyouniensis]|uniref:Lytic transglycosylase domain-containing protein n=1 Tax=Leptospira bouyouniensis TaxID=2484911 RepID=A0A7I0HTA0_9LEPT|nr:lytic transglycosylase domain-containing protein [Leptospira bouyouniensis]TGL07033.1 lytic transglycosylase domain-containing protein [Leptospira bouyouniensis]TGM79878.1 lytic transglycosylase domain-containing protein [Leptospira bouyouniensis]